MTPQELADLAMQLVNGQMTVETLLARTDLTDADKRDVRALAIYEIRFRVEGHLRRQRRPAQRRALGLLRSLLTSEQRAMLSHARYFHARGSAGGLYRLCVETANVQRIERHGSRYYGVQSFCIHGPEDGCPPADETISQLLLLSADEPAFLATANAHDLGAMLWNGEWRRELAEARRQREDQEGAA